MKEEAARSSSVANNPPASAWGIGGFELADTTDSSCFWVRLCAESQVCEGGQCQRHEA